MYRCLSASIFLIGVLFLSPPLSAQTASSAQAAASQSIPDLSGIWEAPLDFPAGGRERFNVCGEPACARLLGESPVRDTLLEEPQMLPWAEERYKFAREGVADANAYGRQPANPYFSACTSLGPSAITLATFNFFEVRQFPDVVFLFFGGIAGESDHAVRRIYVDGRGHPPNRRLTSMGHSIGHYEGDVLVVDTIGIDSLDRTRWVDLQGHRHSDALRLTERFRRVDQTLEYEVAIHDPQAYTNSWSKKIVRALASPGPRFWEDSICEELLQMGTHYGAEAQ